MLIRSGRNTHRYIEFRDNRIRCLQTHKTDRPGLIDGLGNGLKISLAAWAVISGLLWGAPAFAELPTGYSTASGSATFSNDGTTLTIHASNRAIINYSSFNIGARNTVNIFSPLSLHRVTGGNPSQILGALNSDGKVFLVNPSGIFFGPGASVNVQGLVASTLDIKNDDFLAGKYTFQTAGSLPAGAIVNYGKLNGAESIALIGGAIQNAGQIQAPQVQLAVGDQVTYQVNPDVSIRLTVDKALQQKVSGYQAAIRNSGDIEGEQVHLQARLAQSFYDATVNNSGVIRAQGFSQTKAGEIVIVGQSDQQQAIVENSGMLIADGTTNHPGGGLIHLEGDTTSNSGQIHAIGAIGGQGGTVEMLGKNVLNLSGSEINASGDAGGGTILLGGDYQGKNPLVRNASFNYLDANARVFANALSQGNGGKIIQWANNKTMFLGQMEAKGGSLGGNGGFVETSGHNILKATGSVNASASAGTGGQAGQWLLDPNSITIQNGGSDTNVSVSGTNPLNYATTADNAIVTSGTIQSALNNGTDVTVQTSTGGSQAGDITVDQGTTISKTSGGDATLTLKAHKSILFQGSGGSPISISSSSNKLNLILNADTDQGSDGGVGGMVMLDHANITTNGGNLIMGGGANPLTTNAQGTSNNWEGIDITASTLSAGTGDISMRGAAANNAGNAGQRGIYLRNGSQISTTTGDITVNGTGGDGTNSNHGVFMDGNGSNTTITTQDGAISVTGQGGNGSSDSNRGIYLVNGAQIISTGTGSVTVQGTGGNGTNANHGVFMDGWSGRGSNTIISAVNGDLQITGTGQGTGDSNRGIYMVNGAQVASTGTGAVTVNGTGGNGTYTNDGIMLDGWSTTTTITSQNGNISVTGQGGNGSSDSNRGVYLYKGGQILSTGSATITVHGTGGNGTNNNNGVQLNGNNDNTVDTLITSVSGNVTVTGQGGSGSANDNTGLYINNQAKITSTGSANITLTGIKGANTSKSLYTDTGSNILGDNAMTGDLTLVANDYTLNNLQLRTAGQLVYKPYTASTAIGLNGGAGTLQLGSSFLNLVDTATVTPSRFVFGDASAGSGTVTIGDNWDLSAYNASLSVYGGNVTTGGITVHGGKDLLLQALAGDVTVDAGSAFSKTSGGDANFSLLASRSILLNGTSGSGISITSSSNKLNVLLNADTDQGSDAGEGGAIALSYADITSNGGDITLGGGSTPTTTTAKGTSSNLSGVSVTGGTVSAGSGAITLNGHGRNDNASSQLHGISLDTGTTLQSVSGDITLYGTGGNGVSNNHGVNLSTNTTITSQSGAIDITGQGGDASAGQSNGVTLTNDAQVSSTGSATIDVTGTGGAGGANNYGLYLDGNGNTNTQITGQNGDITLTGAGGSGTGGNHHGLYITDGGQVSGTGNAVVSLFGTQGAVSSSNAIVLDGSNTRIASSANGNALVLSTSQNFINNVSASVFSTPNGRWLVYSANPSTTTEGGLSYTKRYNRTYAGNAPGTISESGDLMLYSVAPVLTVTADNKTRAAGQANPALTGVISGSLIDGDSSATAYSGSPAYSTTASIGSPAGTYAITAAAGSLASSLGYQFNFVNGQLTVTGGTGSAVSIPYLLNPVQNPNTIILPYTAQILSLGQSQAAPPNQTGSQPFSVTPASLPALTPPAAGINVSTPNHHGITTDPDATDRTGNLFILVRQLFYYEIQKHLKEK